MPCYIYQCPECEGHIEVTKSIKDLEPSDQPLYTCKECSTSSLKVYLKRVPARCSFKLKGYGWASDGYSDILGNDPEFKRDPDGYNMNNLKDD